MTSSKTVILGEASESDTEEILLDEDSQVINNCELDENGHERTIPARTLSELNQNLTKHNRTEIGNGSKGGFGTSLFSSLGSSIPKLVNYSPYNLLTTNTFQNATSISTKTSVETQISLSPLHKTLYTKNQQLYASLAHLYRHPYEKTSKGFHSLSQRLVGVQKTLQDVDNAVMKIIRESKNLDVDIEMIS